MQITEETFTISVELLNFRLDRNASIICLDSRKKELQFFLVRHFIFWIWDRMYAIFARRIKLLSYRPLGKTFSRSLHLPISLTALSQSETGQEIFDTAKGKCTVNTMNLVSVFICRNYSCRSTNLYVLLYYLPGK